jgi:hypothetical protein
MNLEAVLTVGPVVGVGVGLAIRYARQRRSGAALGERVLSELVRTDSVSLPELAPRVGLRNSFVARGRLMHVLQPMIANGLVLEEEPRGTRSLKRLRFRLRPLQLRRR